MYEPLLSFSGTAGYGQPQLTEHISEMSMFARPPVWISSFPNTQNHHVVDDLCTRCCSGLTAFLCERKSMTESLATSHMDFFHMGGRVLYNVDATGAERMLVVINRRLVKVVKHQNNKNDAEVRHESSGCAWLRWCTRSSRTAWSDSAAAARACSTLGKGNRPLAGSGAELCNSMGGQLG
jgi:hypothetical protein